MRLKHTRATFHQDTPGARPILVHYFPFRIARPTLHNRNKVREEALASTMVCTRAVPAWT